MQTELDLLRHFLRSRPEATSRLLETVPIAEAAAVVADTDADVGTIIIRHMTPSFAACCLAEMDVESAVAIVCRLPVDTAGSLLRRISLQARQSILDQTPQHWRAPLQRVLRYPPDTVGALMDPMVHVVTDDVTAGQALQQVREVPQSLYFDLPVVDRRDALVGHIDVRQLLGADPNSRVTTLMERDLISVYAHANTRILANHPGWEKLDSLPVVDEAGVVVGAIRHRTLRNIAQRKDETGEQKPALNTLLAFGELYWKGLTAVLSSALGAGPSANQHKSTKEGKPHGT